MVQQQTLLYTLGLIVVGAAILVGIQKFTASHQEASIEALRLDLSMIAAKAQLYCHTPRILNGGDHSFSSLANHPDGLKKLFISSETENGCFKIISGNDDCLIIQAIGKDDYDEDGTYLTVEATVYADSLQTKVINY